MNGKFFYYSLGVKKLCCFDPFSLIIPHRSRMSRGGKKFSSFLLAKHKINGMKRKDLQKIHESKIFHKKYFFLEYEFPLFNLIIIS
jgi:hypothetical protein